MKRNILAILISAFLLSGCPLVDTVYGPHRTPHEEFIALYEYFVGKTIQLFRSGGWGQYLIQTIVLPNGNLEDKYDGRFWKNSGSCWVYYEYDPKTKIITSWRYEGSDADCIWQG